MRLAQGHNERSVRERYEFVNVEEFINQLTNLLTGVNEFVNFDPCF